MDVLARCVEPCICFIISQHERLSRQLVKLKIHLCSLPLRLTLNEIFIKRDICVHFIVIMANVIHKTLAANVTKHAIRMQ